MQFIFQQWSDNDVILTANRRLASYVHKRYDNFQVSLGKKNWQTPLIIPFNRWIENLYEIYGNDTRILLTEPQQHVLWENIICSQESQFILNVQATALQADQAFSLLSQWDISFDLLRNTLSEDVMSFVKWADHFNSICNEQHWIHCAWVPHLLIKIIENAKYSCKLPRRIILAGFDNFSPVLNKLINILKRYCEVILYEPNELASDIKRISFPDQETEIYKMASWAKHVFQNNSDSFIGCVVPNLVNLRSDIKRIFTEVLSPSDILFNISASEKLINFPIIYAAILILKMNAETVEMNDVSFLLRSPFLGGAEHEFTSRSTLDMQLRSLNEIHLFLRKSLVFARQNKSYACSPIWSRNIEAFLNLTKETHKQTMSCQKWSDIFVQLLQAMGWPGERPLNSEEFQLVQRWHSLLDEFASFDLVVEAQTWNGALHLLQTLCQRTLFQPRTDEASIQILGTLEAAGITFNHLWVMGMNNETWPPLANPNPFIPIKLQQQWDMPHSSAERELQFCQRLTNRFCSNAENLIFSYSASDHEGVINPSPLITSFPIITDESLHLSEEMSQAKKTYQTSQIETFLDNRGPPVLSSERIRGGSWIFKAQAQCPFRAFAEIRLGTDTMSSLQLGLTASERGTLLHAALARVWSLIKTHDRLCEFTDQTLEATVSESIDFALSKMIVIKPLTIQKRFANIERRRLTKLLVNWLQFEKKRSPFTVVSQEQSYTARVNGIEVELKIDRIDQLHDGTFIIIDYKTGKPNISSWIGQRPDDPQLPLYCITQDRALSGLTYAQVRADSMQFKGVVLNQESIPGTFSVDDFIEKLESNNQEDNKWRLLLLHWQETFEYLADEFKKGNAEVNPKDETTCHHCQLHTFCRINAKR